MAEIENLENIDKKFDELKGLISDIRTGVEGNTDYVNQLYKLVDNIDNLTAKVSEMTNEKFKPTDEFTILQTNVLEVKKELSEMNDCINTVVNEDLRGLMSVLTEKVNRLEILTNNSGIDQKVIMNMSEQMEKNIAQTIDRSSTAFNENLKGCVEYIENACKALSEDAVSHISEDITLLGSTLEKTTDNLKRSIIDMLSRVQVSSEKYSDSKDNSVPESSIEMLKNGIYNLNVNTEQRFIKLNRLVEELEVFNKLESFSKLNNLPAIGQLKQTLNNTLNDIVDKYSYTLQTSQNRDELNNATQQFRKEVYNSIISMLGNVTEFLVEEGDASVSGTQLNNLTEKIEDLTSVSELNNSGYNNIQIELNDLRDRCSNIQEYIMKFSDTLSDVRQGVSEIQTRNDAIKNNNNELGDVVRECTKSIIENSEPDRNYIKEILNDIKKNISILQSGDEGSDYTYSMQDIESDVAKIRIYLNELSQSGFSINTDEFSDDLNNIVVMVDSVKQQLNKIDEADISDTLAKLKEDVTSISTRVNKLILTSDNSLNMIESSLKEFKILSEEIDEQLKAISSTNRFKALEDGMDALKIALNESNSYNNVINQSLIMLAEWVDNAGEMITNIHDNQSKLDTIDELKALFVQNSDNVISSIRSISEQTETLIKEIPAPNDYSAELSVIDGKLAEQNVLIEKQEERLNKLDEKLTTILEFIAKNNSGDIVARMNDIDEKMDKLAKNISKLTSFVSEE